MSQAKVDKYKKEKKNRAKNLKKKKVKKVVLILLGAVFVGSGIGYPLGQKLYKVSYEKRINNATISADVYDYWFAQYWSENYYSMLHPEESAQISTDTDATEVHDHTHTDAE